MWLPSRLMCARTCITYVKILYMLNNSLLIPFCQEPIIKYRKKKKGPGSCSLKTAPPINHPNHFIQGWFSEGKRHKLSWDWLKWNASMNKLSKNLKKWECFSVFTSLAEFSAKAAKFPQGRTIFFIQFGQASLPHKSKRFLVQSL